MSDVTSLNSLGKGVVPKVAHGPSLLVVDIGVARGRGPTNPTEERGIRPWGAGKEVPRLDCKILQVKHNLVNPNRNLSHQALQILQLHINIRVLSCPQTFDISVIMYLLQIMHSSSPKGMLNTKSHTGIMCGPLRELLEKVESA